VGYSETSKAYRIFTPEQLKIVVSRDVNFEEDFAYKKSHEPIPVSVCSSDRYFRKGVYLRKLSLNVSVHFPSDSLY
jgi:hypothetical protein